MHRLNNAQKSVFCFSFLTYFKKKDVSNIPFCSFEFPYLK